MWEDNLGKAKTRRSKNSKPYERPKSILRRVTDSVTGLLPQHSWLVNWLQSTSPKKEDAESEEVEEEQPVPSTSSANEGNSVQGVNKESFIFRRPPGASKEQLNGRTPVSNIPSVDLFPDPVIAEISREQLGQTNGDDDSNSESTSGCSSLLPHPEHKRDNRNVELPNMSAVEPLRIDQSSLQIIGSSLSKSLAVDLKNSRGRKTLSLHTFSQDTSLGVTPTDETRFHKGAADGASSSYLDDTSLNRSASKRDISQPQLSAFSSKRPRFNITSFGPSAAEARRSLLNESVVDSPFYAGRTTYGGASAYRRATLQPSATLFPYVRKRIQARPSSISSAPPTPSGSMPTTGSSNVVLSSSAQRILQALEAMSTPVRDAKRIPAPSSSRRSSSMHEEDLSFSGFGLSRRRPNLGPPATKLSVGTPAQIVSRPTQPVVNKPELDTSKKLVSSTPISAQSGGKMRSRKSAPLRESVREAARIREEEEEEPITSDLQAVPMPIGLSSLPSFSLLPPPTVTTASQPSMKISTTSSNGLISSVSTTTTTTTCRPAFTFSAPLVTVSPHEAAAAVNSKPPVVSFNFSSPLLVKPVAATKTPVKESSAIQQTEELKSGSVLEALGNKPLETITTTHTVSKATTDQPPVISGFGEKFKPPSDSWTCSVCCVTNPKDQSKCLACESPGPSAVSKPTITTVSAVIPTTSTTAPLITKGFGDQFKMSASQWECSVCMVRNPEKEVRCKSCEEPKPGVKPTSTPSSVSSFKFGIQTSTAKFGADASAPAESKEFSFGGKKDEVSSSGFKFGAAAEPPKETAGFKFGSTIEPAKETDAGESGGFKFGTVIDSSKKTESAGFKFGTSLEPAAKKPIETVGGFKFGAEKPKDETTPPVTTPSVSSAPVESVGGLFNFRPAEPVAKKPEEVKSAPEEPVVKKTEESSQGFFKIPAVSTQGASGLFNTAATTTTAASKSSPIFSFGSVPDSSKAATLETGSVMDILGKKPVTTTPSFGQQQPVSSSAPSFSFGAAATEPAKPLFSFAKPEAVADKPVFAFGSTPVATTTQEPAKSIPPTTTTTAPSFSFTPATSAPSLSLFKPSGSTPFNFGGSSTVSGASAPTTTAAPTFSAPPVTSAIPAFGAAAIQTAPPRAFGMTPSTVAATAPASSLFSFGAAPATTPATTTASTGGFSFGLATTSAPTTFAFGSQTAPPPPYPFANKETSSTNQPSASGFGGFSAPSTVAAPTVPAAPAVFAFGASSAVPATTTPSEAPKLQFSFGTPQQTTPSTASAPTFGSFGATKTTSAPFTFGSSGPAASSTPAFGEMTPKSTLFGSQVASSSTPFGSLPPSGFGAAPTVAAAGASSTSSPFSFGATAPTSAFSAAPSFNFGGGAGAPAAAVAPQQQPTGPVFQFGSSSSSTPAVNSSFSFGSSPAFTTPDAAPSPGFASGLFGAGNPFDNTGSAGGPSRKIRKAVRRR